MKRVVIDTNVLISAIGWGGAPQKILTLCLDGKFKLVLSPELIAEIKDVLFRERFNFIGKEKKDELILLLSELAEIVSPDHKVNICRDVKDNMFLDLAISGNVDFLITRDEDLLMLGKFHNVNIIAPNQFLKYHS